MANTAWAMDLETKDLCFTEDGLLDTVEDYAASIQCVRLTLEAWKGDFELVPVHGTEYQRILGEPEDEDTADEVIREAIFQEPHVSVLEELEISVTEGKELEIECSGKLGDGTPINLEVSVNG